MNYDPTDDEDEPPWSLSDVEPWIWFVIGGSLLVIAYGLAQVARLAFA